MLMKKISLFSFFSGIGCLDLGFEYAGFDIKFVNEYSKEFLKAYKYARKKLKIKPPKYGYYEGSAEYFLNNSTKYPLKNYLKKENEKGSITGFIAGPPCPDFSIAGKNKGEKGSNGRLSAVYIDLVCKYLPDFFLFENVKGLWKTKKHREFFEKIKKKTHKAGYITAEHLVNALNYGAPQDRKRIILIGFKKNLLTKLRLPDNTPVLYNGLFPWNKYAKYDTQTLETIKWPTIGSQKLNGQNKLINELTVGYWFKKNNVEKHPNAKHYFNGRAGLIKFKTIREGDVTRKSFKKLHRLRFSPTAAYGNNEVHIHPYMPRRISASEALAIQSMPKEFSLPPYMTLTDMFKSIGNGVPFLTAKYIALTVKDFLKTNI